MKGTAELQNNPVNFNIDLYKNNILKSNIKSKSLTYNNNLLNISTKNLNLHTTVNLNYFLYKITGDVKFSKINYKTYAVNIKNASFSTNNNTIKFNIKNVNIPKLKYITNVNLNKLKVFYDFKNTFLILSSPEITSKYKQYNLSSYNNNLIFKNINNLNYRSNLIKITDNNNSLKLNKNLLTILGKYTSLSVNNGEFTYSNINLNSSKIISNLTKIFIKKIYGKAYGFDTLIQNVNINLKKKSVFIKKLSYNNVKAENITYQNNKITLHSNNLFNKNALEILYKFIKIKIPVIQIGGTNNITTTVNLDKNITTFTKITTSNSLFKLAGFHTFIPEAEINVTNNKFNFTTKNAKLFLTKSINLLYSGSGLINFKKRLLNINGKVNFKIDNIIDLKEYNESVDINITSEKLFAKNSKIYIDFNKKELIINPLIHLLKYTAFKPFVSNGILLITFGKTLDITSYLLLKLPILYNHSNKPIYDVKQNKINRLFLNLNIGKNIKIYNKNVIIDIKNTTINAFLNSLDINLYPLERLLTKSSSSGEFNYTINLYTTNANLIYKTHKFLSQRASLNFKNGHLTFQSKYKNSSVTGYTRQGYLLFEGKNFSNEEFIAFLPKFDFFKQIKLDFVMVKSPDDFYSGKIFINNAIVTKLKALNNIIAFINTVPSLLTLSSPGFSSKGYKIKNGYINYLLYKKILYIKTAKIIGNNLDFFAKGYIDFNKNYMFLKIDAKMKMKVNKIPVIGKGLSYLLFGKDGSIDVKMIVKGDLDNPKVKEDIGKSILLSPFKLFKRAVTLPFHLF